MPSNQITGPGHKKRNPWKAPTASGCSRERGVGGGGGGEGGGGGGRTERESRGKTGGRPRTDPKMAPAKQKRGGLETRREQKTVGWG